MRATAQMCSSLVLLDDPLAADSADAAAIRRWLGTFARDRTNAITSSRQLLSVALSCETFRRESA